MVHVYRTWKKFDRYRHWIYICPRTKTAS